MNQKNFQIICESKSFFNNFWEFENISKPFLVLNSILPVEETRHFEFICQSVAQGLKDVALKYDKPVIFGVLTTDTFQQALDRAGGKYGNKGDEAAITAIKMINL